MSEENKIVDEKLEANEIDLDNIENITGGIGPVVHKTRDITKDIKNKA